jgi:eukaryotic-like serine/threonine-protein kinase
VAGYGVKPEVGHVLEERYLLERVIGEGGMGVVYAARHVELGEVVAVKILHPSEAMDDEHLERFLREARLCAKIKNDHVVRVLDVARGTRGGFPPYIVMEFLDGFDLATLIRARGPLPYQEAVDYLLQACEAVAEAHQLGIVHRDLKPSNLLLTKKSDGSPLLKVLDFGISKAHDEQGDNSKLTTTTAVFGSPAYMSPEQIRSAKHVDGRADLWALAVVLFEILTGRLPFVGDTAAAILAGVAADPPLPLTSYCTLPREVGRPLQAAVEACLIKDRDRRCPSVVEMANLLAPFASAAGLRSVESVRRIATAPRPPPGTSSSQSRRLPDAPPPPLSSPAEQFADTTTQLTPPFMQSPISMPPPAPVGPASGPHAVGRTDRGMVVASRRNLKSTTLPLIAGAAVIALLVLGAVGTIFVQSRRSQKATQATSESSTAATLAATASEPPPVASTVAAIPTETAPPASSSPKQQRGHAPGVKTPHTARATASSPPPPTPTPAPSPSPHPTPPHVDTDSRQ